MIKCSIVTSVEDNIDEILKDLEELNGVEVSAGYYNNKPHPEHDDTYPNIAFYNTFGALGLPRRPFMQDAGQMNIKKITKIVGEAVVDSLQNKSTKESLDKVAKQQKSDIKSAITNNNYLPNAEPYRTEKLELYGSSQPLIATGAMRDNIDTKISKKEIK